MLGTELAVGLTIAVSTESPRALSALLEALALNDRSCRCVRCSPRSRSALDFANLHGQLPLGDRGSDWVCRQLAAMGTASSSLLLRRMGLLGAGDLGCSGRSRGARALRCDCSLAGARLGVALEVRAVTLGVRDGERIAAALVRAHGERHFGLGRFERGGVDDRRSARRDRPRVADQAPRGGPPTRRAGVSVRGRWPLRRSIWARRSVGACRGAWLAATLALAAWITKDAELAETSQLGAVGCVCIEGMVLSESIPRDSMASVESAATLGGASQV